jgi:hypothetical protein
MLEAFTAMNEFMRKTAYVNCWRSGVAESMAMWDLYGKGSGIVAIKTTIGLLKSALSASDIQVFIGEVKYVDWGTAPWHNNHLVMCARKDTSYSHESEVRVIVWEASCNVKSDFFQRTFPDREPVDKRTRNDPPYGVRIPVNLSTMVTEIVVGPREKPWILPLIQDVLRKYDFSFPIRASDRLTPRQS